MGKSVFQKVEIKKFLKIILKIRSTEILYLKYDKSSHIINK